MGNITISGILTLPTSGLAAGDKVRFTHKSTTGQTVDGSVSPDFTVPPDGTYSFDIQYGIVQIETWTFRNAKWINHGDAIVNIDQLATTLPDLIGNIVPVTPEQAIRYAAGETADPVLPTPEPLFFWRFNGAADAIEFVDLAAFGLPTLASLVTYDDKGNDVNAELTLINSQLTSGTNLLLNGAFDIWQDGDNFTDPDNIYTADMWIADQVVGGSGNGTVSRRDTPPGTDINGSTSTYFLRVNQTTAAGGNAVVLANRIEDVLPLGNATVTLSFSSKCDVNHTFNVQITQNFGSGGSADVTTSLSDLVITGGAGFARYEETFVVPSTSTKTVGAGSYLEIRFRNPTNGTFILDMANVKLEEEDGATQFSRAGNTIAGELSMCQRYYWRGSPSFADYYYGTTGLSAMTSGGFDFPTTMRDTPIVNQLDAGAASNCSFDDAPATVDNFRQRVTITSTGRYRLTNTEYEAIARL